MLKVGSRFSEILTISATVLLLASPAAPSVYAFHPWQEDVFNAAIIGVAECTAAGESVAKFRVLEVWKGTSPADEVLIESSSLNLGGIDALCGEKYLIAVTSAPQEDQYVYGNPLTWRKFNFHFSFPPIGGLDSYADPLDGFLLSPYSSVPEFKSAVDELLVLDENEQELLLLQEYTRSSSLDRTETGAALTEVVYAAQTAGEAVEAMVLHPVRSDAADVSYILTSVMGANTRRILQETPAENTPFNEKQLKSIRKAMKLQSTPESQPDGPTTEVVAPSSTSEVERLRVALDADPYSEEFVEAFRTLTKHDPASVAAYLVELPVDADSWDAYQQGSYFAFRCETERVAHLKSLLQARNDLIRVAAVIYLTFEDYPRAIRKLRAASKLPGDAGAWAAINLLRRGDKRAMPRALKVFEQPGLHSSLQCRLELLLSNSCQKSGVALPNFNAYGYDANLAWWNSVKESFILYDPWFEELAAQKID